MSKADFPLRERSISDIYISSNESDTYQIPIYQRNYAWGEDEITALIKDVYDSFNKATDKPYYIGTLVTYKREECVYEVIDGQQRLTTIYLILKALKCSIKSKLTYTARTVSALTLKNLPEKGEDFDKGIYNGYEVAATAIEKEIRSEKLEPFKDYFINQVHIIHYHVPKDVDLNHYFEVMNSRGEQLEKHEIVKSILSQKLSKSNNDIAKFSRIWEACSNMSVYIQQAFDDTTVFGKNLTDFEIESFDGIPEQNGTVGHKTILELIGNNETANASKTNDELTDKFQPIIDFPNLLLQALKLTLYRDYQMNVDAFSLDDKELLNEFNAALVSVRNKKEFVKKFAYNLLLCRYYLDNYIVHHTDVSKENTEDNPWRLQYYYKDNNKRYSRNLIDKNEDGQEELVQLLSMFEVTFTAKQRKNYLFYCLVHLFNNWDEKEYLDFLRGLADKYFFDVYLNKSCLNEKNQPGPNAFDNALLDNRGYIDTSLKCDVNEAATLFEEIYKDGDANIPLFVFCYTDYKIWTKYARNLKGERTKQESKERKMFFDELGCSDFKLDILSSFYFSRTRKSLEHYYPQAKAVANSDAEDNKLTQTQINCFGNFAMIGADANSSGSNWDPKRKLDVYSDSKSDPISVASLKFKVMMQMCKDNENIGRPNGMEWNAEDMKKHQKKMLEIICCQS